MKTIVTWNSLAGDLDGTVETFDGLMPSIDLEEKVLDLLDSESGIQRSIELPKVAKVEFEPDVAEFGG